MKSRELRARRAKLIEDARALIGDKYCSAEETMKFDKMMAEADRLKEQIDRMEQVEAEEFRMLEAMRPINRSKAGIANPRGVFDPIAAFDIYLRGGLEALSPEARAVLDYQKFNAAMGTTSGRDGGFTVPDGFYRQLVSAEKAFGGMLEAAHTIDTDSGNPLAIPTDDDTGNVGAILHENTQVAEVPIVFGTVALGAFTYTSGLVRLSQELIQDTTFDLSGFLTRVFGERLARVVNTHCTAGDGVSKPSGVVTEAALGVTAASATSFTADELMDLEHAVDRAYRLKARFMLSDNALGVVKKLKDGAGRYLWLASPADGEPDTILGHPYTINQDVPAIAPSAKSILFGDFSKYYIRRITGARVLRLIERYADYNQIAFVAFQRWDGALIDAGTHPVKYLAMHS
jgi:HK97 family phage major capsid protein